MLDFQSVASQVDIQATAQGRSLPVRRYHQSLRCGIDRGFAWLLLIALVPVALILAIVNSVFNRGPLFLVQTRMGRGCQPFQAIKFRTMTPTKTCQRGPFDGVEQHRITALGGILRKMRIDELPQIINVIRGEMSLIGPRPDLYDHARTYLDVVPHYHHRHCVLPGISGLAQVTVGYVDGLEGLQRKVAADLSYIHNANARLDLWIVWQTVRVIVGRKGV